MKKASETDYLPKNYHIYRVLKYDLFWLKNKLNKTDEYFMQNLLKDLIKQTEDKIKKIGY